MVNPTYRKLLTGSGLLIGVVLFFAINVLSTVTLKSARLDLTDQQLYTLSEGSQQILEGLQESITLRFYLSKKLATGLPGIKSYAIRVQELLEEFEQTAGGKMTLKVIDPEPFSEEEDRAVGYGLQGVPIDNSNTLFYFGLVGTSSTDDQEVVPFFSPEREEFLEYDLAKLVYQLAHPKQKVVGLLSSLPLEGITTMPLLQRPGFSQPWLIIDQIQQLFEVRTVTKDVDVIPKDVDVLMIVHPKHLNDTTLYAIDQFVLRGGRALVFVDPHSEGEQSAPNPGNPMAGQGPRDSDLGKLFEAWGVQLVPGKVVGDLPIAKKVQFRKQSRLAVVDYPVWIDLTPAHLDQEDVVTAKLDSLTLATPGFLQKKGDAETEFVPLVQTDEAAMQIDAARVQFFVEADSLVRTYRAGGEKLVLAARVTGKVKTAFPDGKPKRERGGDDSTSESENDESQMAAHVMESVEPINVIVVADTDLLQDRFWVQVQSFLGQRLGIPTSGNGTFVTNALDNLTGSNELISIRNRGSFSRPFTLVRALQQEAKERFRQKEQLLQDRLRSTERKLQDLQSQKDDGGTLILSAEQQKEIARFRGELLTTRKELRSVQHELQKNIESLESIMKFMNIGLMPLLVGIGGVVISVYRLRRRQALNREKAIG